MRSSRTLGWAQFFGAALAAVAMALGGLAGARPTTPRDSAPDILSATVSYADLDLRTEAGRRELDRRIDAAVLRLSGQEGAAKLRTVRGG
jgi:UrcA family protein